MEKQSDCRTHEKSSTNHQSVNTKLQHKTFLLKLRWKRSPERWTLHIYPSLQKISYLFCFIHIPHKIAITQLILLSSPSKRKCFSTSIKIYNSGITVFLLFSSHKRKMLLHNVWDHLYQWASENSLCQSFRVIRRWCRH